MYRGYHTVELRPEDSSCVHSKHIVQYSFKWQYMVEAGAGAGAEIMDKGGAKKEPEPNVNNFGSATHGVQYM